MAEFENLSSHSKARKKRAALYWPSGSQFVAEFYITVFIPAPSGVSKFKYQKNFYFFKPLKRPINEPGFK